VERAISRAICDCTSNTSEISLSNVCCHFTLPVRVSISSGTTCTRRLPLSVPAQRTLPTSR